MSLLPGELFCFFCSAISRPRAKERKKERKALTGEEKKKEGEEEEGRTESDTRAEGRAEMREEFRLVTADGEEAGLRSVSFLRQGERGRQREGKRTKEREEKEGQRCFEVDHLDQRAIRACSPPILTSATRLAPAAHRQRQEGEERPLGKKKKKGGGEGEKRG